MNGETIDLHPVKTTSTPVFVLVTSHMYVTLLTYFFRRCEFGLTMPIVPRVSYRGGAWNSLPPLPLPEILKLSMVINALSQVLNNNLVPDCVRSNLRGSKFLWEHAPHTPLVGTHAYVCVEVLSHTTIILLPPCFPPPPPPPQTENPVWYHFHLSIAAYSA